MNFHRLFSALVFASFISLSACAQETEEVTTAETTQTNAAAAESIPAEDVLTESQVIAWEILMNMAVFLAEQEGFRVDAIAGYDAVQDDGQMIQFVESREIHLDRPGRLRISEEIAEGWGQAILFDGELMTIWDSASNVYAQVEQPGEVDHAIVYFVRELGMRIPLAPLLTTWVPQELQYQVSEIEYVEMTNVFGQPAHHIAARTSGVDFQAWIADGDTPVPLRAVLTYPDEGRPQYWAQFSNWVLNPEVNEAEFVFEPQEGMQQIPFVVQFSIPVDEAAESSAEGE